MKSGMKMGVKAGARERVCRGAPAFFPIGPGYKVQ